MHEVMDEDVVEIIKHINKQPVKQGKKTGTITKAMLKGK